MPQEGRRDTLDEFRRPRGAMRLKSTALLRMTPERMNPADQPGMLSLESFESTPLQASGRLETYLFQQPQRVGIVLYVLRSATLCMFGCETGSEFELQTSELEIPCCNKAYKSRFLTSCLPGRSSL
jgi:hypothetical protein